MQVLDDVVPGFEPEKVKKPRKGRKRKPAEAPALAPAVAAPVPVAQTAVRGWATFGVAFMAVLSALLNGYANAQHSPVAVLGWLMGLSIPVIVLTLAKVAGEKFRTGQRAMSYLAGGSGVALLFLSVWHCSQSIALITGSPIALAMPLAVAIDAGLIACELALITEPRA